ncbi:protein MIX23 [Nematostella vectensis]|uniref:protein MIX23 n=1 Tax=Nematostella vectensis TaxID=45351 RepID=UPI0013900B08|nr:protein MIX23 [Nematostella vectensis]
MAAAEEASELKRMSCHDFREFKEALKVLRLIDDKIIYKLNTSVPTASFEGEVNAEKRCRDLYGELLQGYSSRESAIKGCIHEVSNNIRDLREKREQDPDSNEFSKKLRNEQTMLRLMQSELLVEEVVKERSLKVFNERCWKSFKPPQ